MQSAVIFSTAARLPRSSTSSVICVVLLGSGTMQGGTGGRSLPANPASAEYVVSAPSSTYK